MNVVKWILIAISSFGCKTGGSERQTPDSDLRAGPTSGSFLTQLRARDCVADAQEIVNNLPGGPKRTGQYTARLERGWTVKDCIESLQQFFPGIHIPSWDSQAGLLHRIRPPQNFGNAGGSFLTQLRARDCVADAQEIVNNLPGGPKRTGQYTARLERGWTVEACIKSLQQFFPGIHIPSWDSQAGLLHRIRPPQNFGNAGGSFLTQLRARDCVADAREIVNNLPGGPKRTGQYTARLERGWTVEACIKSLQQFFPGIQIPSWDSQAGLLHRIRPPQNFGNAGGSFLTQLRARDCVADAQEIVNNLPGGPKRTGQYTARLERGWTVEACIESLQQFFPGIQIPSWDSQAGLLHRIRPPQRRQ